MDTLETLLAKDAIRERLAQYCRAFDRIDLELSASIWHEDGTANYITAPRESAREFIARSSAVRRTRLHLSHQITSAIIRVEGDRAISEAYGTSWTVDKPVDGIIVDHHHCGRYLDTWSKRGGRWAVDARQYLCDAYTPIRVPTEKADGTFMHISKPNKDDPSYAHLASLQPEPTTLATLEAKAAIREVLSRYCMAFDRMDHQASLSIWHEDGTAQYLDQPVMPLKEFLANSENLRRGKARMSHHITNAIFQVNGGRAVSEAYGTAILVDPPKDGSATEHHFRGRYLDTWSKRRGRWAIDHRTYICDCYTAVELDASRTSQPNLQFGQPNVADASYAHWKGA